LNEEPGVRLFRTSLWLTATSVISRVLDKILDKSTRAVKSSIHTALVVYERSSARRDRSVSI